MNADIGHNRAPLDWPEELPGRLEDRHEGLLTQVMDLDLERLGLPKDPQTDEECGKLTTFVAKTKKLAKAFEDARKAEGAPYLDAQRVINDKFKEFVADLDVWTKDLTKVAGRYAEVKAERERAERAAKEREERRKAEEARAEEQRKRDAAEAAAQAAEEAAAKIRMAETAKAHEAAAQEMREAEAKADGLREEAEDAGAEAAKAERKADSHERAQSAGNTALSRVHGDGGTASVSMRWTYRIADVKALRASLGPLGHYFGYADLETTIARAVREQSQGGVEPTLNLPGVEIFRAPNTNIRAARG